MVYRGKISNFTLRVLTACILAPLVLYVTKLSGMAFIAMVLFSAILMGGEWFHITSKKNNIWKLAGVFYILLASLSLIWIIQQNYLHDGTMRFSGVNTVISILVLVWANDVGGYIFGKLIGGKKLCPTVSPNKTWAGFFGGMLCCVAVSPILAESMIVGAVISVVSSAGDLLESWAKRKCNIKDSGEFVPGHGGLLDRVDGVLLVSIFVAFFAILMK